MDKGVWNTRFGNAEHPLETFWAERFLIHDSHPHSGPLKLESSASLKAKNSESDEDQDDAHSSQKNSAQSESSKFSLTGLSGIWVPFGGGTSLCPGRHLAKEEILLAVANLIIIFDFKLVDRKTWWKSLMGGIGGGQDGGYQHEMRYFGMGVLPPRKDVEVMIRRRS